MDEICTLPYWQHRAILPIAALSGFLEPELVPFYKHAFGLCLPKDYTWRTVYGKFHFFSSKDLFTTVTL
jgi:hypothetical protein